MNGLKIAGFILAIISMIYNPFGIISIPAGIMCLCSMGTKDNGLAYAGITIAAIATVYNLVIVPILM